MQRYNKKPIEKLECNIEIVWLPQKKAKEKQRNKKSEGKNKNKIENGRHKSD